MNHSFWKYLLYISSNWILFYACAFVYNLDTIRYSSHVDASGIFLAIVMLALIPIIELPLFIPFKYIIRQRGIKIVIGILLLLAFEFGLNMILMNRQPELWMYGKAITSFFVGMAFYYRPATSTRKPK